MVQNVFVRWSRFYPRHVVFAALICGTILSGCGVRATPSADVRQVVQEAQQATCAQVDELFTSRGEAEWTEVRGRVVQLLSDSHGRYLHQRFVLVCPSGHTVLVVNDVSIGQRVPLRVGDQVAIKGKYVWNAHGGLLHFTHHNDMGGSGGWIVAAGHVYS